MTKNKPLIISKTNTRLFI